MRRRRLGFLLIFGALVPLAVAATAWACGTLATLKSNATVANPGQQLTLTGINYSSSASFTPVQIRWNSRTGPVIAQTTANPDTSINTTVAVPAGVSPGWYTLNATQYNLATGAPKTGTPGRTTVRVQGAAAAAASPWGKGPGAGTPIRVDAAPASPALLPTLAAVLLSLGLLGGGLTLLGRGRTRKANRPLLGA